MTRNVLDAVEEFKSGVSEIQAGLRGQDGRIKKIEAQTNQTEDLCQSFLRDLQEMKRAMMQSRMKATTAGGRDGVSEGCARWLAGIVVMAASQQGKLNTHVQRDELISEATSALNLGRRDVSALTTSEIPMPTEYGREVVEMVYKYGQARQYATVYPLGTGTAKLPKLKTSPAFGFIDVSAEVGGKAPAIEFVDIAIKKAGGIIRVPSELSTDFAALGQFLTRYIAREFAKWEDTTFFLGDGSATYKLISGVGKKADTDGYVQPLGAGKSSPIDITVSDCRLLRAVVDGAALGSSCYYCHPSHEALFSSFNTVGNQPYIANGLNGPRLDGFPIRWVGVMPVFDAAAHASQFQITFGDLGYWFISEMGTPNIATSRDVYFGTDEIALRGLERFDVSQMADGCTAVLKLGA